MKQWDILMFPFAKERRHPAVIISNDESCQNPDIEEVNALLCTSAKVNREPKALKKSWKRLTDWIGRPWFAATGFIYCPNRDLKTERGVLRKNAGTLLREK